MPRILRALAVLSGIALLSGCATVTPMPQVAQVPELQKAEHNILRAKAPATNGDKAAGLYLSAADISAKFIERDPAAIGTPEESAQEKAARTIYNQATAELTALLSRPPGASTSSKAPPSLNDMWAAPRTIPGPDNPYLLSFATDPNFLQGTTWNPDYFNSLTPASEARRKVFKTWVTEDGIGGALVGAHGVQGSNAPRPLFLPRPVFVPATSVVNFKPGPNGSRDARLTLYSPSRTATAEFDGKKYPISGDFSAPLATIPRRNELLEGLYGMLRVDRFKPRLGTYFYAPYTADKIPVIMVHGLMSTSQIWFDVANDLSEDPVIRNRYQFWVFYYPTGNPIAYSALRLRQDIAKIKTTYQPKHGMILIGHSMGGLLSKMQVQNSGRHVWDVTFGKAADKLWPEFPDDSIIKQSLIFQANPDIKRVIFISTPHRGSGMATGIGAWTTRLISLPSWFLTEIPAHVLKTFLSVSGAKEFKIPTSVEGLSPKSPLLAALDDLKIEAPFDSIIGDRGRSGDKWLSSDGVVPYSSSHLEGAQSELMVPTDHGAFKSSKAVGDIRRILLDHLKEKQTDQKHERRNRAQIPR
ncbi:MAG TPA: hypothetical protein VIT91_10175 [Chthoniobacterales bacterium]